MKLKSHLLAIVAVALACCCFCENAQARRSGTLLEDNSGSTNSVSNASSGKKGGGKKISEVKIKLIAAQNFAGAKGSARSRVRTDKQDLEVEIQGVKRLAGSVLGVTIGDTVVGTITIDSLGRGKLELSTENGDIVPAIPAGTLVGVVTDTGAIVLAGTF